MVPADTLGEFLAELASAGPDPDLLQPWPAWKAFKAFLRREVSECYDAASFQASSEDEAVASDPFMIVYFVRQFSHRTRSGGDVLTGRLVVELVYRGDAFATPVHVEVWTHDFPALEEWASIVEGLPQFQAAMSAPMTHSSVYYEAD